MNMSAKMHTSIRTANTAMRITSTGSEGGDVTCGDCGDVDCISTETIHIHILFIIQKCRV
jgi:glucose-6-phosphate dehydrogenase assembly protein OpcA